ncbi:hypothetical protein ACFX2C_023253 [Malus domestica]
MKFGIRTPSKLFMLKSNRIKSFNTSKEGLISPPNASNVPSSPSENSLRRLSVVTRPVTLLQPTPLHLQQSSPTQDESRPEGSVRPGLSSRRAFLSVSLHPTLRSALQKPSLVVSKKRKPDSIISEKSWMEALLGTILLM